MTLCAREPRRTRGPGEIYVGVEDSGFFKSTASNGPSRSLRVKPYGGDASTLTRHDDVDVWRVGR
ncbi:hypothetical protein EYF80_054797 [Liparis tanakae]|uniref:Uncharacterized protein n=1 Tax=Liparis tanakae TaxID=230148 RepID=A0A4Z2F2D1_9TELE|nr:hypothetical protein EYF80_054797 [Liparis tanakae]